MLFNLDKIEKLKEENSKLSNENRNIRFVNQQLTEMLEDYKAKNKKLEAEKTDPIALVNNIVNNGIEWFNWSELPDDKLLTYHNEAQQILRTTVFKNEYNRIINDRAIGTLKESDDYQAVRDMRMQVTGIELLKARLASIPNPYQIEDKPENPNNPI